MGFYVHIKPHDHWSAVCCWALQRSYCPEFIAAMKSAGDNIERLCKAGMELALDGAAVAKVLSMPFY